MLISILGALSGVSTRSTDPPKFGAEQDYVVVGQTPRLDGFVSEPGVVRQVRNFSISKGLFEQYNRFSAQDILLKIKLLGRQKSTAFSLIFFRVDGEFLWAGRQVDGISSPSELGIMVGNQIMLERPLFFVCYIQSHLFDTSPPNSFLASRLEAGVVSV